MKTILGVSGLMIALGMSSISNAQEVLKKPEGMLTTSPQLERYADVIKRMKTSPDLMVIDLSKDDTCRYVAIYNQGLRPAGKSTTNIKICELITSPEFTWESCQKDGVNIETDPILPRRAELIITDDFLSNESAVIALKVTVDSTKAVNEADEDNNQLRISCSKRNLAP